MTPRQLLQSFRYEEAILAFQSRIDVDREDWESVNGLATALISARRYADALPLFERLSSREKGLQAGMPGRGLEIAVIQWILGKRTEAEVQIRKLTDGILNNSILYGDGAGGITQGVLLYYMGGVNRDSIAMNYALSYLRTLASRPRIQQWPGPIAQFLLAKITFSDLLEAGTGVSELTVAAELASRDVLKRRRLCNILFGDAVFHRGIEDESFCLQRMTDCVSLTNPLLELDWYLARYDADLAANRTGTGQ